MAPKAKAPATKKSAAPKKMTPAAKKPVAKKASTVSKKPTPMKVVKKAVPAKKSAPAPTKPVAKKKVAPIPKGYHSVTPYMVMQNAQKAIDFYQKVFGAKTMMKMDKPGGKIGHAELKIGDAKIMLCDEFPEMGARSPQAFGGTAVSIHLYTKNVDTIVKAAVTAGAKLLMPVQDTYYGDRSGSIEDPFGHKWHIATRVENVSPATMKKRAAEMAKKKPA